MAISKNGAYGHPNGKIGKLVHYMLKGQPVVRVVGRKSNKLSDKQRANCMAMSATVDFLRPIHEFIKQSFDIEARGTVKNQYNLAVSYTKKQALQGEYPDISVDYSRVVLSYGTLPNPMSIGMEKESDGISFSWDTQIKEGMQPNDMAMILLYFPLKKQAIQLINPTSRSAGHYFVALDNQTLNEPIESYICFKSTDGNSISDSVYLGSLD